MTLLTSGSVRNKLRVDEGCSKVYELAWKASEEVPISLKIKAMTARLQSIPRVSPTSSDVFCITVLHSEFRCLNEIEHRLL